MITVLPLTILTLLTVLMLYLTFRLELEGWAIAVSIALIIALLVYVIGIVAIRCDNLDDLQRLQAFRTTLAQQRERGLSDIERAAIAKNIVEWNERIAAAHYWNNTIILDIAYNDKFANQEPVK